MARLLTVQIIATNTTRGEGTESDPVRRVDQWFDPDGTLLLEYDPTLDVTTAAMNMVHFLRDLIDG